MILQNKLIVMLRDFLLSSEVADPVYLLEFGSSSSFFLF